jgi:hypothetical protein
MSLLPVATAALAALLGAPLAAQSCSDLTVTGDGKVGTQLTFSLTGAAANAPAFLVLGETSGSFSISFGSIGTLDLGIVPPFSLLPFGQTDGSGAVSRSVTVPPLPGEIVLHGQGFTARLVIDRGVRLDFCTSDVERFTVGGS